MRFCAEALRRDPNAGIPEYVIEAELLHEFRRHGADGPAYGSIVAAGGKITAAEKKAEGLAD